MPEQPSGRRVVITGTSSAGKTTLGRRYGALQRIRHIDLDDLYWLPGWISRSTAEFRALVAAEVAAADWVISGNYRVVRDLIWPRADTIVWLDYPFPVVLLRGLQRAVRRIVTRELLPHGNRETFRQTFLSRDSILLWIITTHGRRRQELQHLLECGAYPQAQWIVLRQPQAAETWVQRGSTG